MLGCSAKRKNLFGSIYAPYANSFNNFDHLRTDCLYAEMVLPISQTNRKEKCNRQGFQQSLSQFKFNKKK